MECRACSISQGPAGTGAVDATQRASPRRALGIVTTVIDSAALRFVPARTCRPSGQTGISATK
jgi:hypothetical protein